MKACTLFPTLLIVLMVAALLPGRAVQAQPPLILRETRHSGPYKIVEVEIEPIELNVADGTITADVSVKALTDIAYALTFDVAGRSSEGLQVLDDMEYVVLFPGSTMPLGRFTFDPNTVLTINQHKWGASEQDALIMFTTDLAALVLKVVLDEDPPQELNVVTIASLADSVSGLLSGKSVHISKVRKVVAARQDGDINEVFGASTTLIVEVLPDVIEAILNKLGVKANLWKYNVALEIAKKTHDALVIVSQMITSPDQVFSEIRIPTTGMCEGQKLICLPEINDDAELVGGPSEQTVPQTTPGQTITAHWSVRNSGFTIWDRSYTIRQAAGMTMEGPVSVRIPATGAGGTAEVSATFRIPQGLAPGFYASYWQLENADDKTFGPLLPLIFEVTLGEISSSDRFPAAAVWNPDGAGTYFTFDDCNAGELMTCIEDAMRQAGASSQALDFVDYLDQEYDRLGHLMEFTELGKVDLGITALYAANDNFQPVLLNGQPEAVVALDAILDASDNGTVSLLTDPAGAALLTTYPDAQPWIGDSQFVEMRARSGGGQSFVFDLPIVNGCHACEVLGTLQVALDFDLAGRFLSTEMVSVRSDKEIGNPGGGKREVCYESTCLTYDSALAAAVTGETLQKESGMAVDDLDLPHIRFRFDGYPVTSGLGNEYWRWVSIYPAEQVAASDSVAAMQHLLESPFTLARGEWPLPYAGYLPPRNAGMGLLAGYRYLDFDGGAGFRFLVWFAQDVYPIQPDEILYAYQGLSADGRYFISAEFPVRPLLDMTPPALPDRGASDNAYYDAVTAYNDQIEAELDALPAELFQPHLDQLDAVIRSIRIESDDRSRAISTPTASVAAANLHLRRGPGTDYASLGTYPRGSEFTVIGKSADGSWLNVRTGDGVIGWMATSFLSVSGDLTRVPVIDVAPPSPIVAPKPIVPGPGVLLPTVETIFVAAGNFIMGSTTEQATTAFSACQSTWPDCSGRQFWFDGEQPQNTVYVAAFSIMRTEVTNAQYAACVDAGACSAPGNSFWRDSAYTSRPVTHVTYAQAHTYATWVGGRLPTEAEWEKACRSADGRIYPWGNAAPDGARGNTGVAGVQAPATVGSYPAGASPYGAVDMSGNVWEWTSSLVWNYPYQSGDGRESQSGGGNRVTRGGSYADFAWGVRCANRAEGTPPGTQGGNLGFRVVFAAGQEITPPVITPDAEIRFWADMTSIVAGSCTTLYWDVRNVREVYLGGEGQPGQGSQNVCPTVTTAYDLRVIMLDGTSTTRTVEVQVNSGPHRDDLHAYFYQWSDGHNIHQGECLVLYWSTSEDATAVYLDGEQVNPGKGERQVCPAETHTYRLQAFGEGGQEANAQFTLEVIPESGGDQPQDPVVVEIYADQDWQDTGVEIEPGGLVTIEYVGGTWAPWDGSAYDGLGLGWEHPDRTTNNLLVGVPHSSLIGRFGSGDLFLVGNSITLAATDSGRLYLRINDMVTDDNSGSLRISIAIDPGD